MNEILFLVPSLVWGVFLGAMFFGCLWCTVRKCVPSTRPALWLFSSLLLRTTLSLAGFYVISNGHWAKLLVCLLGFTMVRPLVTRLTRLAEKPPPLAQETGHAP
jgi:F1F0 ATPase subunit 2